VQSLAIQKLKTIIPYFTYVMLFLVMSNLASEFIPRETIGFVAEDSETALNLEKAHLWNETLSRTGLQLLIIPCAVFGALLTGRLSALGLFTTAVILHLSVATSFMLVLDKLVPPDQASFFSSQGLLEYPYWEFFFWQLAVNAIVPVLALVAIRHLTSRLNGTPAAPIN
jgi:hypothetical protein